ncbi:MAG: beta-ketoacyl-[acyl-carrier-protein] synthase family protein, partial [Planctomycetes bacterium]|nr:beta-ketoacyl-[acyl-carrier-protein] synthase family protein [Planctomycetota bacterium]
MPERRVAITGLGVITPAGIGLDALWAALLERRGSIRPIEGFDVTGFPCRIGGRVEGFSARKFVPKNYRKSVKVMARDIELAVGAADLAFRDAGIVTRGIDAGKPDLPADRIGCNIGAGLICADMDELGAALVTALDEDGKFSMQRWGAGGMDNLTPLWLLKYLPNMLACHVTIIHGAMGASNTITCGDASGHLAIGEAGRLIARGAADVAIAGGAESKLNPMGLLRQHLLKRLCTDWTGPAAQACRPFDQAHCGTVIGEGSGLVVLENMDRAVARGARIYAELAGFGSACDPAGIDVLSPNAGSLDLAVRKALDDAGTYPEDVDLIVTHGTGVPGEDACEAACWQAAMGDAAGS